MKRTYLQKITNADESKRHKNGKGEKYEEHHSGVCVEICPIPPAAAD